MNTNRKFVTAVSMIAMLLLALFAQTSTASAMPQVDDPGGAAATDCAELLAHAEAVLTSIDHPASRAEYMAVAAAGEAVAECLAVAGVRTEIPVTGRALTAKERFLALKDLQAEMLDRSGAPRITASGYSDPRFMEFKERQAEGMMP